MHNFSNKSPNERVTLTFDFTDMLAGDSILSVAGVSIAVTKGVDAAAASMLIGSAVIATGAQLVLQTVGAGVDGVNYRVTCKVNTATEILELAGTLRVRSAT
jgi:hypothetical protein